MGHETRSAFGPPPRSPGGGESSLPPNGVGGPSFRAYLYQRVPAGCVFWRSSGDPEGNPAVEHNSPSLGLAVVNTFGIRARSYRRERRVSRLTTPALG